MSEENAEIVREVWDAYVEWRLRPCIEGSTTPT